MDRLLPLETVSPGGVRDFGGKAAALAAMIQRQVRIPRGFVIPTRVYREYIAETGIDEKIRMEMYKYPLATIRWEQIWDIALRIRNHFLTTPFPPVLRDDLTERIWQEFKETAVAVRSSAPMEDAAGSSFAGIHESFIMQRGPEEIMKSIRLVWASLWSDRAILYRKELNLAVEKSSMAVVIQEMIPGRSSGIVFTTNPTEQTTGVVEAVYGLNQALVDGSVMADRWLISRRKPAITSFQPATRTVELKELNGELQMVPLKKENRSKPPLENIEVLKVYEKARELEKIFAGKPQDMEWTVRGDEIYVLQCRPITSLPVDDPEDKRDWYRKLSVSLEQLKGLLTLANEQILPGMEKEAATLALTNLQELNDQQLLAAMVHRQERLFYWRGVYYEKLIPMAHGPRLLGQVYNDRMQPDDPFEFIKLLVTTETDSIKRNRELRKLSQMIGREPGIKHCPVDSLSQQYPKFAKLLYQTYRDHGSLILGVEPEAAGVEKLLKILIQWSEEPALKDTESSTSSDLETDFLKSFKSHEKQYGRELLDTARATYKMRDDDNLYLGKVKVEFQRASAEARKRLSRQGIQHVGKLSDPDVIQLLRNPQSALENIYQGDEAGERPAFHARQLVGQPASEGLATGPARIVNHDDQLMAVQAGDILVCDAIDPRMTFVVPLVAGIIERRGGMLIHGAIIAREYGIPCITGVDHVTHLINSGDQVTLDGYTGIITNHSRTED
jgi:pyruvate,water dikinase